MNRKIPFLLLVNNGIMSKKYLIEIVFKSPFEEIMGKGKHKSSNFFHRGVPRIDALRRQDG
jgi:hypothetical protein